MSLSIKCVFWISLQLLSEKTFHSVKNWARYDHKCISVFMPRTCNSCQILIKLQFSRQIFENHLSTKFHKYVPSGRQVVPWGRITGQTRQNSALRSFAKAPKSHQISAMCGLSVLPDFVTSSCVLFFPFRFAWYQAKSSKSQTHTL